jgi:hypothetical protein
MALPAGLLVIAACALTLAARWPGRPGREALDRSWSGDGLPAAHAPYRVIVVSSLPAAATDGSRVRPWPRVLADIAAGDRAPRPVIVASVGQPGDDWGKAVGRFGAWRLPADLVVLGAPSESGGSGIEAAQAQARARGVEVLTLEVPPLLTREDHQHFAQQVAEGLRERGRLEAAHVYADHLDLAAAEDDRAELAGGFWEREDYPSGLGGRWTHEEATLQLERRGHEGGLVVALSMRHPLRRGSGRVEVGGRSVRSVSGPNGRWNLYLDVRDVPGSVLPVRIVAEEPFVPRAFGPTEDARTLGLLVHAAWLTERPVLAEVDMGTAEDGRLELASGFWQRERFPDGRVGRWSKQEATLLLEREAAERGLVLDVSLEHPEGVTTGRVEVGEGRAAFPFRWENGSRREVLDVGRVPGRQLSVRFVVDTAFRATAPGDTRMLGLFVHDARLVDDPEAARAALLPNAAEALGEDADWPGVTQDLDIASAAEGGPALRSGFGPGEAWPDGRSGRWTFRRAVFHLPRTAKESELVLDLSCQSPWNLTTGWIEVGGVRLHRFRSANGRQRLVLDLGDIPGEEVEVAILVDRPFRRPDSPSREFGLFLHRVRLARR